MTEKEAGTLLVTIRDCFPNYQITQTAAKTWKRVLGDMTFEEAQKQLDEHFREDKFPPTPFDLISRARAAFDPDSIVPLEPPSDLKGTVQDG